MLEKVTNTTRRGLNGLVELMTDPLGKQQAHLTRLFTHERAVWLSEVVGDQARATNQVVLSAAEQCRAGVVEKVHELEVLLRYLRKKAYLDTIRDGELDVPVLHTEHLLAVDSNDTLHPRGAKNDNSVSVRFNQRLYQLFGRRLGVKLLDLGCAGGGLVRSILDDGHFAVGLEGSDYPLLNQCGEWGTIPHHLLTCDITKPFTLMSRTTGEPLRFDAITAWEVMEHIPEERIAQLMRNIDHHLAPGGWVLCSIATFADYCPTTGVVWHQTVQPRAWWEAKFAELGFVPSTDHPFGSYDWLRGSGNGKHDWQPDDGVGFHIALRRRSEVEGK